MAHSKSRGRPCRLFVLLALLLSFAAEAAAPRVLEVDVLAPTGRWRPLHGINKGAIAAGGLIDLTTPVRALQVPWVRLHDCQWPYPDIVDVHAVFRNFAGDPENPSDYDFALTDDYLAAVQRTGARIIYRLGESIEHAKTKRFVHPPRDPQRWAAVCLGIIRHYNEGWAGGQRYGIPYWEIWNEPENRPAMWTGTEEEYLQLYRVTSRAIKAAFPSLKVGGPAVGYSGQLTNGELQASAFVTNFLGLCRRESLPLDFFSWHCYTADPQEFVARARGVRQLLDRYGFTQVESHLTEWNYLPGNSWNGLSADATAEERRKFYTEMSGPTGAAFLATALLEQQDAPIDVGAFYHGDVGGFGLFDENGVPTANYHVMRALTELWQTSERRACRGGVPGRLAVAAGASSDGGQLTVVVANYRESGSRFELALAQLPPNAKADILLQAFGANHTAAPLLRRSQLRKGSQRLRFELAAPGVAVIKVEFGSAQDSAAMR